MVISIDIIAQPVILNGSNIPAAGLSVPVSMATPTSGVGNPGASQTWDFSSLSFTPIGTVAIITPSSSPIGSSFSSANHCQSLVGQNSYNFFSVLTNKMECLGYNISTPGSGNDYTPNPRTILKFPFNYLDTETDTWQKVGGSVSNVTLTYDGYGTLITPTATYTNVVRIKEDYGNSAVDYQWYTLNPLMGVMINDHNTNRLYFMGVTATSVFEQNHQVTTVNIYPNPASNKITVNSSTKINAIEIYNLLGENIYQSNVVSTKAEIDLTNQAKGIYFLKIYDGRTILTKKIVIE